MTQPATSITAGGATLNATVNPGGASTSCYFQYGTDTSYGSFTATNTVSGTSVLAVSNAVTGLLPGTPYHFRAVGTNSAGNGIGSDMTLTTLTTAPGAVTQPASAITPSGVALNATVNPEGAATAWYFQYGTDTSYGSYTPTNTLFAGTVPVAVNSSLTGLFSGTSYHFQIVATNSAGTSAGIDQFFTTAAVSPPQLTAPMLMIGGSFQFSLTNTPGASFSVVAATNIALALSNWATLGTMTEVSSGQYQFIDAQATNAPQKFYRARLP